MGAMASEEQLVYLITDLVTAIINIHGNKCVVEVGPVLPTQVEKYHRFQ